MKKNLLLFVFVSLLMIFKPRDVFAACADNPADCLGVDGGAALQNPAGLGVASGNIGAGPEIVSKTYPEYYLQGLLSSDLVNPTIFGSMMGNILTNFGTFSIFGNPRVVADASTNGQPQVHIGGAAGFFASGIEMMIKSKPASSTEYIAYMGNNLRVPGTPEPAYAAGGGFGFNGLSPILNIWALSRNIAYFLFSIIFVVIGIMIMTRRKIDPKTVATVQNALPKIIFALVIVSFSYAIAGFLIDMMYVVLGLIVTLMSSLQGNPVKVDELLSGSIFNFALNGAFAVTLHIGQIVGGIANSLAPFNLGTTPIVSNTIGGMTGALAMLVVAIAILVALFRTWFALIGAFANIVLGVIFAPLRLTLDAIPGQNQFGGWIRDLLANMMTFPLVTVLLAIGAYIASFPVEHEQPGFTPPLLGAGTVEEVLPFVGLGILLTIPKALDIMRETLKAPAFKFGGAWMESATKGVQGAQITGKFVDKQADRVQVGAVRPWAFAKGKAKSMLGI